MRDTSQLYYPFVESVLSILPIVEEFIVVLGNCSEGDTTRAQLDAIGSPKIKIIDTVWDTKKFPRGMVHAQQTDVARFACSGDWLFYLQADEVVHEKYLPIIKKRCEDLLNDEEVEGLLFAYKHFFGDYEHYANTHGWYPNEIRIIKNHPHIHSYTSAQSFRKIPDFDGANYRTKEGVVKLKVASVAAEIYHYGWVRPPHYMQKKSKIINTTHQGATKATAMFENQPDVFNYGDLNQLPVFRETHPAVMEAKINQFNWQHQLNYGKKQNLNRPLMKHEKWKYKMLYKIERHLFGGRRLFGYKAWTLLKR